ncbi:ribosomal L34 mitochondrial [Fusarium pseudoanthophilum]|uniref:Ribosomal L34 mitochondrial n=1 Tax=Fusarium pseudoanthophilum TaxID=48495 RepID=A0A8H5NPM8_9HYPO|nr:ribosomal L34 mitochondrial [Fusarium pseudoanthophilum]
MFSSISRLARPVLARPLAQSPRTFTTLVPLRPSLTPMNGAIRRTALPSSFTPSTAASADIVPSSAISAHPALGDMQIRCGPRNTMNGHTRLVQKRRHGFLCRKRSKTGRKILLRRKIKGRRHIAHSRTFSEFDKGSQSDDDAGRRRCCSKASNAESSELSHLTSEKGSN